MSWRLPLKSLLLILCLSASSRCDPSIIIIGAGPAGVAAASKLLQNSMTNLTILEAEDRIGGRINSVRFGRKFVDVGAEYCHGTAHNVVYQLVKDLDVLEPMSEVFQPALYYSNGSRLERAFTEELQAIILGYDKNNVTFNGSSFGDAFTKKYTATIVQRYSGDAEKIKILNEALRLAEKVSLMIDGAFSWLDTSTVKHYERSAGHQLLVWKGRGYKTILEVLTKEFPNPSERLPIRDKTLLNKQVSKINWNETGRVVVETQDATKYEADHVIFTPSVGVLKDQKDVLFDPYLPKMKLDAIEAIGIAGVMKIILHFENEWWKSDDTIFTFLWNDEDLSKSAEEFPDGPIRDGVSWVSAVTLMAKVPGNPQVLASWVTGAFIPEIEKTPDHVLKDGCMYILKKFLGEDYNITLPDQIIKSTWRSNPYFRGTYSFERAGFAKSDVHYQSYLAEPLTDNTGKPIVLFAGEASNPVHYSTVHGAIETGFREAERLIQLYKK